MLQLEDKGKRTGNLAALRAEHLWQSLTVILGSAEKEYRFVPVSDPEDLIEPEDEERI